MKSQLPSSDLPACEPSEEPWLSPGAEPDEPAPPSLENRLARWVELTERKRKQEAELRTIQDELTEMEEPLLEDLTLAGIQNVKVNGMTVFRQREFFCKARPDVDRDKLIDAFRLAGMAHAVIPSWQSLRALAREWSENGDDIPEAIRGMVDVGEHYRLRSRKS